MTLRERVEEAIAAANYDEPLLPYDAMAIAAIEAMRDAPKNVLWAGALHAVTEKDLEIWNAMIDEALRG